MKRKKFTLIHNSKTKDKKKVIKNAQKIKCREKFPFINPLNFITYNA